VKKNSVDDDDDIDGIKGQQNVPEYRFDDEHVKNQSLAATETTKLDTNKPTDYEEIVNAGVRSDDDGMYHWETDVTVDDDELISSSENIFEGEREQVAVGDLDKPGSYVVVSNGGIGGIGNCAYAKRQHVPDLIAKASERAVGKAGEVVHLELELKLIADVGLVGFPNAGKSSLLAAMSKAQPEIAPYPFTTLHPLVGTLEYNDGFRAVVADVPGLIGGAAEGRGRGFDFLRHLERTKALLYIVDAAGVDGRDPLNDLRILVDEIKSYGDSDMLERPALVVANKMDLIQDPNLQDEILIAISITALDCGINFNGEVHGISAGVTGEGLGILSSSIRSLVDIGEELREERNESASYDFTF
jgi:Obg family GTPase CgtA